MIAKGSNSLKAYVGSTSVSKMYKGDVLVYSSAPPSLYDAEVEWLASEQDAWINTGINGQNSNLSFELEVMVEPTSYPCYAFGNYQSSSRRGAVLVLNSSAKATARVNASMTSITGNQFDFSEGARHQMTITRASTTVDGVSHTNSTANASSNQYPTIALFKGNTRTAMNAGKVTIYWFKIYDSGTLVRDYVPVRKGTVGYMYDRVSGELFGNAAASGTFIYGADVSS